MAGVRRNMSWISWIVLGLIAGALAKFLVPGKDPGGCFVTIIVGILGAVIGGYLGTTYFGWAKPNDPFGLSSIAVATGGAIILLIVVRLLQKLKG